MAIHQSKWSIWWDNGEILVGWVYTTHETGLTNFTKSNPGLSILGLSILVFGTNESPRFYLESHLQFVGFFCLTNLPEKIQDLQSRSVDGYVSIPLWNTIRSVQSLVWRDRWFGAICFVFNLKFSRSFRRQPFDKFTFSGGFTTKTPRKNRSQALRW